MENKRRGYFKCTRLNKIFNADLIAAYNILMTLKSTLIAPITPSPEKGVGVIGLKDAMRVVKVVSEGQEAPSYPPELAEKFLLFGKWRLDEVEVKDPGLKGYICLKPMLVPHSGGRHEHRRFGKAEVNVVERLANMLMRPGPNGGKKSKALKIVRNALEIIHLKTGENPVQVLVRAIENAAPREDVTRLSYGGIVYFKAVDISPQRRLDLALRWMGEAVRMASFRSRKTPEEALADEIIAAAQNDASSYAIRKKNELERIALASR